MYARFVFLPVVFLFFTGFLVYRELEYTWKGKETVAVITTAEGMKETKEQHVMVGKFTNVRYYWKINYAYRDGETERTGNSSIGIDDDIPETVRIEYIPDTDRSKIAGEGFSAGFYYMFGLTLLYCIGLGLFFLWAKWRSMQELEISALEEEERKRMMKRGPVDF